MIPITQPVMDQREAEAAGRVILSGWVTQGPEVAAFEREFADVTWARPTPVRCRTAPRRCTWPCWPWAWARATR